MQRPDELYHYGIKGMRWGVRHGPPYPLYRQSSYWKRYHQRPPGGRIGGFNDSVKAAGKKWREEGIPNKIKYPVGMAAAGAVGLAAGANVAFTRNAIKNTKDMIEKTPFLGKMLPKGKERVKKDFRRYLEYSDAKVKAASTLALLVGAGVATIAIKKKKEREKELEKIRKKRNKIGELRDEEAAKVQKGKVSGIFSGDTADEKKAKSLANKIEAERSSAKTVERNGVKVKIQSKKLTETENMERVNNSFRIKRTRGNSENCIACSVTMEARRRGYEVKARTDLAHDDDSETCYKSVAKVYKNAKTMSLGTNAKSGSKAYESFYNNAEAKARKGNNTDLTKKLKTTTAKMPKGASGQICIMFDRWSGHSMYFYKDRNGKTIFYDTQRNKKYTEDQLNSMFIQNSSNIVMQRFDGCDINEKELLKYSK
jgi:hypothetical protein